MIPNEAAEHNPELEDYLRRRIAAAGGISFAEYMQSCLYHPDHGYYMTSRRRIGKAGDFFTSSSVHPIFGRLLARQLVQFWDLLGNKPLTVVEQGAGEGHLALDILDALREANPEVYAEIRYRIIEVSADNRARQETLLAAHQGRLDWCSLEELECMTGVLLSNELVDAFPVHLVEKRQGQLFEVFVTHRGGNFSEELRPLTDPELMAHLRDTGVTLTEGSRGEVGLDATRWMKRIAGLFSRGFVMTIDYGYPAEELYAPFRRSGTLMCYHRHQSGENPYIRAGRQDITAHVDFSALQKAGTEAGLATLYFNQQYRFLLGLGFIEELMAMQATETDPNRARALRLTLKNLILPEGGMGETFKVLVQGKDVGQPELLCARSLAEIPVPRC